MKSFKIQIADATNAGDAREWGLCAHYGVERSAHDSKRYDVASDIEVGDKHISVKASAFTLMSGSLCEGRETLEGIWEIFAERVHSNTFAYVTKDGTAYDLPILIGQCIVTMIFFNLQRNSAKDLLRLKVQHAE